MTAVYNIIVIWLILQCQSVLLLYVPAILDLLGLIATAVYNIIVIWLIFQCQTVVLLYVPAILDSDYCI